MSGPKDNQDGGGSNNDDGGNGFDHSDSAPPRVGDSSPLDIFPDDELTTADKRDPERDDEAAHGPPVPAVPAFPDEQTDLYRPEDHDLPTLGNDDVTPTEHKSEAAPEPSADAAADPAAVAAHLVSIVESLLFAADKPLSLQQLGDILGVTDLGPLRAAISDVETQYARRGIQLHGVSGGFQFRTNPAHAVWVQKLLAQKPVRLSRAQLETLAICAYRQPITRPEIDDIRGVDSGGTLKTLMDRSLVRILGKKEEVGRPLIYGTSKEFLDFFSLSDLRDLPTLREFHELSEEHRAQVQALASKAPAGSIEPEEVVDEAHKPLQRVTLAPTPEDAAELEEIDRLIASAGVVVATEPSDDDAGRNGAPS